jgi:hypothetical protein
MVSLDLFRKRPRSHPTRAPYVQLRLKPLESRVVPYAASRNLWLAPSVKVYDAPAKSTAAAWKRLTP